jgi:hypothetical protein
MYKSLAIKIIISLFVVYLIGCGNKKDNNNNNNTTTDTGNTKILVPIQKDPVSGKEKVLFKYVVNKGDKFSYKMEASTSNTENSPATNGKDVQQDNTINYFYTKEVTDVDQNGIITFKVKFDSIAIKASMDSIVVKYNSNVNDSVKINPNFIQYNAVINEPFFMRVTAEGDISDVYGLEKIYENIFKALGDTLKEADKNSIKESFGKDAIKEILQQELQIFPKQEVIKDSSWVKVFNTQVAVFEVVNNAKYIFKGIEDKNNQKIANIEAQLSVEFKTKEAKEKGMKMTVEKADTDGSGKIAFNLNRGCIVSKETTTKLKIELKLAAQGQSAKSIQGVTTNLKVTLLN